MKRQSAKYWTRAECVHLMKLFHADGLSVPEIAQALGLRRKQVAGKLDRMEAAGWQVGPNPKDPDKVPEREKRVCLKCPDEFMSAGIHNRICPACCLENAQHHDPSYRVAVNW